MAYGEPDRGNTWRARYKRPDGTWGSRSGFSSRTAAEDWGDEQEALIRRNLWIDPRDAETLFGTFVEDWFGAVSPRLEPSTKAKYRSVIDNHLLPQWQSWPMIGIFNSSLEIEKWVSELHEEYADPHGVDDLRALLHCDERRIPCTDDSSQPVSGDSGHVG
jgi:hypothetical protein